MPEKSREPKHQRVLNSLLQDLGSGRFKEGEKLPTEMELANCFAVSRPTVTKAVQELVQMGLVYRKAGAGTFVEISDANQRRIFGLIVPELGDSEIFDPVCNQITKLIQKQGHFVQWAGTNSKPHHRETIEHVFATCRQLIDANVAGVFFAPFVTLNESLNPNHKIVNGFRKAGIPVVLLDRDIELFPSRSDFDLVGVDHLRAQARIARFLIETGHRRIAFWLWDNVANTIQLRIAGAQHSFFEAGIPFDRELIQTCDPNDMQQIADLIQKLNPDAIMCANDIFAAKLLKTLDMISVNVPEDLSVAGYDDVQYATLLRVPLSTLSQPCEKIGEVAVQLMNDRVNNPDLPAREVTLTPTLKIRESTSDRRPAERIQSEASN
ncbi:Arabinose metabolism transcriptional repressor [Gimesia maris]|uniref:GntR family transcriptional regulator n=1 Tax=Gimesia maris TaxID=122 RepID=UPI001187E598|nr:GntR family transcriptional regulator [Gimesia maris]QDT78229.1 Arabinose metabolism transcriptional repressor [Gimesia maris]